MNKNKGSRLISIVIPVYNEEAHLHKFCETLFSQDYTFPVEFVFIDDGSKDNSFKILNGFKDKEGVVLSQNEVNSGKGFSLAKGINMAKGDVIAIQDADFEYDPSELIGLIEKVLRDEADVIYGSRFKQHSPQVHRTYHYLGNRILTLLSNLFSGLYLTDMETCYKVFKSDLIKGIHLECKRFGFEPEVTAKISKLKVIVHEHAISYHPRNYGDGKKIGWKDGVAAIWFIIKFNLLMGLLKKPIMKKDIMPEKYYANGRQWL
jgi:glycosyltransferase involved in cell wall biosynthesis